MEIVPAGKPWVKIYGKSIFCNTIAKQKALLAPTSGYFRKDEYDYCHHQDDQEDAYTHASFKDISYRLATA